MQDPAFSIGIIHDRVDSPAPAPGEWHGPFSWKSWVMDWVGFAGIRGDIVQAGGKPQPFTRLDHTWYIIAPGVAYRYVNENRDVHRFDSLWFFADFLRPWSILSSRALTVVSDPEERICQHVHAMAALAHVNEPGSELIIRGHALAVLGEINAASLRGHRGTPDDPWPVRAPETMHRGDAQGLLVKVDQEVMRRLARPLSITELAERLHMSPSSLAHTFKAETGLTVMERARWIRIREARRLLAQPDTTIKSVARLLGFSSQFHLSRIFTAVTGMTPTEFMRRQRR